MGAEAIEAARRLIQENGEPANSPYWERNEERGTNWYSESRKADDLGAVLAELERQQIIIGDLVKACDEFREAVLHDRHQLAEEGMTNDQTNSVLGLFDDTIGAEIDKVAAPRFIPE